MKTIAYVLLLGLSSVAYAQKSLPPVEVSGQFVNTTDRLFLLQWTDHFGIPYGDTLWLDEKGSFRFRSEKIKEPVMASIAYQNDKGVGCELALAPGYQVVVRLDVEAPSTLRVTGKGAVVNQYFIEQSKQILADSAFFKKNRNPYQLSEAEFESYFKRIHHLTDSAHRKVFMAHPAEPYQQAFAQIIRLDTKFNNLALLHDRAWLTSKGPSALIQKLAERGWENQLNYSANLVSSAFRAFISRCHRYQYWARQRRFVAPDSIPASEKFMPGTTLLAMFGIL